MTTTDPSKTTVSPEPPTNEYAETAKTVTAAITAAATIPTSTPTPQSETPEQPFVKPFPPIPEKRSFYYEPVPTPAPPARPLPPTRSEDPLVPPPVLTPEQTKIRASLIRGCSSTDVEAVWVDTGQVLKVLDLALCESAGLFKYTVETIETVTKRRRPNSIIPASENTKSKGMSQVNRELLLHLLQR